MIVKGRLWLGLALMLGLTWSAVQPAVAHERVELGPYLVIVGWVEEPVIVNERNAILLEVYEGETPVTGLEGTLKVSVLYAGRTFIGNLSPTGTPGVYHAEIWPTVRGQYVVQLSGTIGEMAVDELIEPEEVLSANVLQFPESQPEPAQLEASVAELQAQLQTAYILAGAGLVLGGLGVAVAVVSLLRSSKIKKE